MNTKSIVRSWFVGNTRDYLYQWDDEETYNRHKAKLYLQCVRFFEFSIAIYTFLLLLDLENERLIVFADLNESKKVTGILFELHLENV